MGVGGDARHGGRVSFRRLAEGRSAGAAACTHSLPRTRFAPPRAYSSPPPPFSRAMSCSMTSSGRPDPLSISRTASSPAAA